MTIKASGRAALMIAAGLWIFALGPSQAADDAENTATATPVVKHSSHHLKKYAHHESSKAAEKSSDSKKTADAADRKDNAALQSSQLPPSVANANAELTDTPASKDAKAMTERANNIVQAAADSATGTQPVSGSPVVASDQLNDVDRALAAPPAQAEAAAAPMDTQQALPASAPAANPPAVVVASSSGNSTWDQTSLIGKIFIGFGALLTLASAARMFIA
jgi:hypothetical protein